MPPMAPTARHLAQGPHAARCRERFFLLRSGYHGSGAPRRHSRPWDRRWGGVRGFQASPPPDLSCPRQGILILHVGLRDLSIAHEQRQVVEAKPPGKVPLTEATHRLRQGVSTEVAMM